MTKVLALTIAGRETVIGALDDPPSGFEGCSPGAVDGVPAPE
jgi:hypothetical protein